MTVGTVVIVTVVRVIIVIVAFSSIEGVGGSKSYSTWIKSQKNNSKTKFQIRMQNGTRKWVVKVLSSHVV